MNIDDLETPCLLLDKRVLLHNIAKMQQRMTQLGTVLRPHVKTAKCADIIDLFEPQHKASVTVSTLKEAEYFFENGFNDLVLAVGITPNKLPRVANLINSGAKISIILDSLEQVRFCEEFAKEANVAFAALIEIDCDGKRAGIRATDPQLLKIARKLADSANLQLKGVMTHAGGSYACFSENEMLNMAERERFAAVSAAQSLSKLGISVEVVSIGSTPTAMFAENVSGVTEIRAGVFMFQDLVMQGLGVCQTNEIAMRVLTSVMNKNPDKKWLFVDAGWTALSRDRGTQGHSVDFSYGQVLARGDASHATVVVNSCNQEHGMIDCGLAPEFFANQPIGSLLTVLPIHACATATMHDRYYVTDDGETVCDVWHRVHGW